MTPEAVDGARPMDAQTRPQVFGKPRGRGFPHRPPPSHNGKEKDETQNNTVPVNCATTTWRTNTGNLSRSSASLRSDHDAVVPVITMAWTD
jgi:hypothetical protein